MNKIRHKNLYDISKFQNIPSGWTDCTIEEICHIGRGRVISQEEINSNPGVYPVYSSQTRNNGKMGSIETYDFDGDYITWTTDGENAGTIFNRKGKFNCTNVCGTLKSKNDEVDHQFLAYQLSSISKNYVSYIGNPKLMNGVMANVGLILPAKPTQKKISKILNTVDNLIEQTQNLINKYTAVKQGMMADLFSRGIDSSGTPETNKNYGQLRPSCEHAPDLYHKTELGRVPKIWEEATLRELLVNIEQGWSPDCDSEGATDGYWGVLKTTSVVWEGFDFSANKALPSELTPKKEYEIKAGDVLMTRAGPGNRVGVVVHVSNTQNKLLLSDKLYRIIPKERIGKPFLALLLSSELIQKQINATKTGLAESQSNISQDIVKNLKVFIPSIEEQELIVERISAINGKIDTEKKYLKKLKLKKKGLMQDLLTGKVKV